METSLNVYDYPDPPVENVQEVSGKIYVTYKFEDIEFPKEFDKNDMIDDIKQNIKDFIDYSNMEIEDVEIN